MGTFIRGDTKGGAKRGGGQRKVRGVLLGLEVLHDLQELLVHLWLVVELHLHLVQEFQRCLKLHLSTSGGGLSGATGGLRRRWLLRLLDSLCLRLLLLWLLNSLCVSHQRQLVRTAIRREPLILSKHLSLTHLLLHELWLHELWHLA